MSGGTCDGHPACEAASYRATNGWSGCVFPPGPSIEVLFEQHAAIPGYNEIVIDATTWCARTHTATSHTATHTHTHTHSHIHTQPHTHTHTHSHIHTHSHKPHSHTHTATQSHTHTYTAAPPPLTSQTVALLPRASPEPRAFLELERRAPHRYENLPSSVEAFFGDHGTHAAFLRLYGLRASDVPLATLELDDFDAPFKPYNGHDGITDPHVTAAFRG